VKQLITLFLWILFQPALANNSAQQTLQSLPPKEIKALSQQYQVAHSILVDFVGSYNFKCPAEITRPQLTGLLNRLDDDTELSVMVESTRLQWRDIYVEARSMITCLTQGEVSKGY